MFYKLFNIQGKLVIIELPNSFIKLKNILIKPYFNDNTSIDNYQSMPNSFILKIWDNCKYIFKYLIALKLSTQVFLIFTPLISIKHGYK